MHKKIILMTTIFLSSVYCFPTTTPTTTKEETKKIERAVDPKTVMIGVLIVVVSIQTILYERAQRRMEKMYALASSKLKLSAFNALNGLQDVLERISRGDLEIRPDQVNPIINEAKKSLLTPRRKSV